jgi:hypothetical protein
LSLVFEERPSDSPYIENVCQGWTISDGQTIRPAEICWHMIFSRVGNTIMPILTGPLSTSGMASWLKDAEILWIKLKPGMYMPHLPTRQLKDKETLLPDASHKSFWLYSSTWEVPNYNNVETFIDRLVHEEMLVRDPVVETVLEGHQPDMSPRTVRHHFLHTTGLSHKYIEQFVRAQQAAELLRQGWSILDTVFETGYYDQPHLTRSLKQFIGYTPAQIAADSQEV